jgi:hypothetical protein
MRILFRSPDLNELDRGPRDLLALFLFADERPFSGVTGLADWRLNSRIAHLVRSGRFTGQFGEVLLMSAFDRLPVRGILLVGLGTRAEFSILRFRETIQRLFRTVIGISATRFASSLPPWDQLKLRATQAIEFWTTELANVVVSQRDLELDIVLYESVEAQRAMMDTVLAFVRRYGGA